MILQMSWFIKKVVTAPKTAVLILLNPHAPQGEIVKEDKSCRFKYRHLTPRSTKLVSTINVDIYAHEDPHDSGAPQYQNENSKSTHYTPIPITEKNP